MMPLLGTPVPGPMAPFLRSLVKQRGRPTGRPRQSLREELLY